MQTAPAYSGMGNGMVDPNAIYSGIQSTPMNTSAVYNPTQAYNPKGGGVAYADPNATGIQNVAGASSSWNPQAQGAMGNDQVMGNGQTIAQILDARAGDPTANSQLWDQAIVGPNSSGNPSAPPAPTNQAQSWQQPSFQPAAAQTPSAMPTSTAPAQLSGTQFNPQQLGAMNSTLSGGNGDQIAGSINAARDAAYNTAKGYLDPQYANQEQSLKASLANQGIPQGSEAWNKAVDEFNRNKTFAYGQAENTAYGQGMTAQNQIAQQLLQALGYQTSQNVANTGANASMYGSNLGYQAATNQLGEQHQQNLYNNSMGMRQQDINELLLQQQNPLTMYNMLTQGTSPTSPNFTQTSNTNVGNTDVSSIYNSIMGQQNNQYNAQVGAQNSNTSGTAMILAALLSDRRLKTNVQFIGMHKVGVPLYTYDYIWGEPGIGVMADELEKVMPEAVFTTPSGFKAVDYGRL